MNTDKLDMQSPDLVNENFEKLAALFPNCVTEGAEGKAIDFDLLKQELSHAVVEGNKERYRLEWPGKREAIVTANLPITKTLRPVREDSVDFDNTENLYIEGDNLEVLKLLQESYLGKIKMIYIDPPYNTGKDFVYKDNFSKDAQEELVESGQKDEYNQRLVANPETAGRYHSDWLSMMYPRLKLARNLLKDDGVIFVSIDDNEVHNLRKVCDDIFGDVNHIATVVWQQGRKSAGTTITTNHEYIVVYSKNRALNLEINNKVDKYWKEKKEGLEYIYQKVNTLRQKFGRDFKSISSELKKFYKEIGENHPSYRHKHYHNVDEKGVYFASDASAPDKPETRLHKPLIHPITKKQTAVPKLGWRYKESTLNQLVSENRIHFGEDETKVPCVKKYLNETEFETAPSVFYKDGRGASNRLDSLLGGKYFDFPKDEFVLSQLINYCIQDDDIEPIVLDFFSGSGTIGHATMHLNSVDGLKRKYILVQLPERIDEKSKAYKAGYKNICEIGKERIRRAAKKIKEETKVDIDYGFRLYRLDSSNMQDVYYRPQDYDQGQLDILADNVKSDRTADDLLAQVMLDWGLPLSLKIEQVDVSGKKVFKVAENSLYACFDSGIDEDFAKAIAKDEPLRIVFKDSGFKNDTAKTNVKQLLKQLSPETEMKVI